MSKYNRFFIHIFEIKYLHRTIETVKNISIKLLLDICISEIKYYQNIHI